MTRDQEAESLLGAYALDAVDDLERQRVERYLATSPRARAEVDDHFRVAMALGNSAGAAPGALWDRIETNIRKNRPSAEVPPAPQMVKSSGAARSTEVGGERIAASVRAATGVTSGTPVALPMFRQRNTLLGAMAACVAALLAISTITYSQSRRISDLRASVERTEKEAATERTQSAKARDQITKLQAELTTANSLDGRVAKLLNSPSSQVVNLNAGNNSLARVVIDTVTGEGILVGAQLPTLSNGHTYQLWGVTDDKKVLSLGVLGGGPTTLPFAGEGRWSAFVLTDEASPGVASSTQPAFAAGNVTPV